MLMLNKNPNIPADSMYYVMSAVKKALNLSQDDTGNIRRCVKTKGTAYGFKWSYDNEFPKKFQA